MIRIAELNDEQREVADELGISQKDLDFHAKFIDDLDDLVERSIGIWDGEISDHSMYSSIGAALMRTFILIEKLAGASNESTMEKMRGALDMRDRLDGNEAGRA